MDVWSKVQKDIKNDKDVKCIINKLIEMGYTKDDIKKERIEMKDYKKAVESCNLKKL